MPEFFTCTIAVEDDTIVFKIEPLHANHETLYIIYCTFEGKRKCFHMLRDEPHAKYRIPDKHNCPYILQKLEPILSDTIIGDEKVRRQQ